MSAETETTELKTNGSGEAQSEAIVRGVQDDVRTLQIVTPEDFQAAGNRIYELKTRRRKIIEFFQPEKSAAWRTHQMIADKEKKYLATIDQALFALDQKMSAWREEQLRREREEQARREAEARKEAEEAALREAEVLEESGLTDEAAAVIEEAAAAPAPAPVPPPSATVHGSVGFRQNWKAQVFNLFLLVKAVAAGKVSINALQANQVFLNAQARVYKERLATEFPGVKAISDTKSTMKRR